MAHAVHWSTDSVAERCSVDGPEVPGAPCSLLLGTVYYMWQSQGSILLDERPSIVPRLTQLLKDQHLRGDPARTIEDRDLRISKK